MRYFKFSFALAIYLVGVWLSTGMVSAATGAGTGFIVSPDGYIITNEHVIRGSSSIKVFIGYKVYKAKIIEASERNDLALLKIPETNLKTVAIGNPLEVQRLDPVVAMGYPAPGLGRDLTTSDGKITSIRTDYRGREGRDTLQHDAVIFRGSSGGPLFNNKGEVIGVNFEILLGSGLLFAIPITDVLPLLRRIPTFDTTQIGQATEELTLKEIDRGNKVSVVYIEVEKVWRKWEFRTGGPVYSPAIGADGTVYVGSRDYNLYAIYPDGTKKWEFRIGNIVYSPAIGADGTIYVGSWDNNLYAIYPDGTKKWEFRTGGIVNYSPPAIGADGTIYVGSWDYNLYAIYPDGTKKWEFRTGYNIWSSPAIGADGTIYVGSGYKLYAINPAGTKKWEFRTEGTADSSPAIGADGTIYVGSYDGKLYAIYPDGTKKWEFRTGGIVYSPAIGADGTIYVGSEDYKLYAINPDGTKKWEFRTGGDVYYSPAIGTDGTIYVGSEDYKLYAINPDGTKKWEFRTGGEVYSSPAIEADGTIYVGSEDYKLYAIR